MSVLYRKRTIRTTSNYGQEVGATDVDELRLEVAITLAVVGCLVFVFLLIGSWKVFHRYQARADANNRVKVTAINIRNAQQQAKVVAAQDATIKAQADQRLIAARGIRNAQDEVAKTLTPLYVQFEAVQAQLKMAGSPNHTVIYVPAGTNGTPVITQNGEAK